jgi:hypothetical protein
MTEEIYSDFFIKGVVHKNDDSLENFINYIFGYDESIYLKNILNTKFFKSDYNGSGIDKLFPLSSMPKNGNCYKNTFYNKKNRETQIHITIEENEEQFEYLIQTISELINESSDFYAYYRNEKMLLPKLYKINSYSVEEILINNSEEYKKIWNTNFKNLNIKY